MQPSFEYAALKYFMLWERVESGLHTAMQGNPKPSGVRRALKHFVVLRSFPNVGKEASVLLKIGELVAEADEHPDLTPIQKVEHLESQFLREFKRRNRSAASKLLWLRHRHPYVLYDSRAADAISARSGISSFPTYECYYEAWHQEYELVEAQVDRATESLLGIENLAAAWRSDKALAPLVKAPWFPERVFDIYLWEFGEATPTDS